MAAHNNLGAHMNRSTSAQSGRYLTAAGPRYSLIPITFSGLLGERCNLDVTARQEKQVRALVAVATSEAQLSAAVRDWIAAQVHAGELVDAK